MKLDWETKKKIIQQHLNDKLPLCVLARKYNVSRANLDYFYSFYLNGEAKLFKSNTRILLLKKKPKLFKEY